MALLQVLSAAKSFLSEGFSDVDPDVIAKSFITTLRRVRDLDDAVNIIKAEYGLRDVTVAGNRIKKYRTKNGKVFNVKYKVLKKGRGW